MFMDSVWLHTLIHYIYAYILISRHGEMLAPDLAWIISISTFPLSLLRECPSLFYCICFGLGLGNMTEK